MRPTSEIRVAAHGGTATVVELLGEHDAATVDELRAAFDRALGNRGIVVDLSETEFLDSSVIHVLYKAQQTLESCGQRLVIQVGEANIVVRALKLAGLTETVAVVRDRDEAITLADQERVS
jgi:anti-anti-sigma factor